MMLQHCIETLTSNDIKPSSMLLTSLLQLVRCKLQHYIFKMWLMRSQVEETIKWFECFRVRSELVGRNIINTFSVTNSYSSPKRCHHKVKILRSLCIFRGGNAKKDRARFQYLYISNSKDHLVDDHRMFLTYRQSPYYKMCVPYVANILLLFAK